MNIVIGTYLICIMSLPIKSQTRDKILGFQTIKQDCKIKGIDRPTIPFNEPIHIYVNCEESTKWLIKGVEDYITLKYWTRYSKETCHYDS